MESARGVIKVMSQAGLEPDGETYRALLSGYAKQGLLNELTDTLGKYISFTGCCHQFAGLKLVKIPVNVMANTGENLFNFFF